MSKGTVLVTGGCGYIGSHTLTCLLDDGYNVVVVDNLINASQQSLDRVAEICKLTPEQAKERIVFHQVDICDKDGLRKVFETSPKFTSCIHFAGLKVRTTFLSNQNTFHHTVRRLLILSYLILSYLRPSEKVPDYRSCTTTTT